MPSRITKQVLIFRSVWKIPKSKRCINTVARRPSSLPCSAWSSSSPSSFSPEIWRLSLWCWGRGEGWDGPGSGASLPRGFSPPSPRALRPSPETHPSVKESSSETNRQKNRQRHFPKLFIHFQSLSTVVMVMIIKTRFYCLVGFTLGF